MDNTQTIKNTDSRQLTGALVLLVFALMSCGNSEPPPPADQPTASPVLQTKPVPEQKKAAKKKKKNKDEFAFAVLGDTRGGAMSVKPDCSGGVYKTAFKRSLDHIVAENRAELVLFTGDMVQGGTRAECLAKQIAEWKELVAPYREQGLEFLVMPGNHEIDNGTLFELEPARLGKPTRDALANQQVLKDAFPERPQNGPLDGGFTYWVRRENALFVVLDAYRPGYFNTVDTDWLDKTLSGPATSPAPSYIFVAAHAPAFPVGGHVMDSLANFNLDRAELAPKGVNPWPWQVGMGGPRDVDVDWRHKRDKLWRILVKHRVNAYFAGHEHSLSAQKVEGVWQFIAGALTGLLYPENTVPLKLYQGKAQNPRAKERWHGGDKLWGYFLISIADGKAQAEVYGWKARGARVELVKSFAL